MVTSPPLMYCQLPISEGSAKPIYHLSLPKRMNFDRESVYSSKSKNLFERALGFANKYCIISQADMKAILLARGRFVPAQYWDGHRWVNRLGITGQSFIKLQTRFCWHLFVPSNFCGFWEIVFFRIEHMYLVVGNVCIPQGSLSLKKTQSGNNLINNSMPKNAKDIDLHP